MQGVYDRFLNLTGSDAYLGILKDLFLLRLGSMIDVMSSFTGHLSVYNFKRPKHNSISFHSMAHT